ncbi:3-oxoacyl-ACP reductase [Skermanella stibiiresistens SB22]|uniref:3-oxoacyl-ACP reductase n=1 Tax=Skermanella stibiiresistens SB22 TaxID=1385369 RepID=W9H4M1_9PROT|nr:SDR family NAD(P)-dependent oxidoreductase [Skermanella stibiiresistens]EWY38693.1 3-oxoacyl-ACP reductase [Skermanella stibiiresistens SB22]
MGFKGKTILVTGASGNLGRAVAAGFAAEGATLVLVGSSLPHLERAFGATGERQILVPADLLDQASVTRAVEVAIGQTGRIDVLCALAGGFRMGEPVHETSTETWDYLLDLNARGLVHTAKAVVPHMLAAGGGKIVTVGAAAAQRGAAGMGAYSASKAAVIRLTEAMSAELRDHGINVNCVLPTIIDTPENRAAMPKANPAKWVAPEDLASVILFLASDAARAVHGAALPVTGLS